MREQEIMGFSYDLFSIRNQSLYHNACTTIFIIHIIISNLSLDEGSYFEQRNNLSNETISRDYRD